MSGIVAIYVIFWVLEGAVRKWLPGLDGIFYVARDAYLVAAFAALLLAPVRPRRSSLLLGSAIGGLLVLASLQVMGELVSPSVAITGLRSYVAPLLLLLLVWRYAPQNSLRKLCRTILIFLPLQVLIIVLQVASSPSAWINLQTGGSDASFVNAGVVRASGTFSSPIGLSTYLAIALACALVLAASSDRRSSFVAFSAIVLTIGAGFLAGSRGTLLAFGITISMAILSRASKASSFTGPAVRYLLAGISISLVAALALFPSVLDSFGQRFEDASRSEDSAMRVLDQMWAFASVTVTPLGSGIGAHSQAGIGAGSDLPWIEVESARWVAELGLLGVVAATLRMLVIVAASLWLLGRGRGRLAPWVFLSVVIPTLAWGQVTQNPSTQGAFAVACVLLMCAISDSSKRPPQSSTRSGVQQFV